MKLKHIALAALLGSLAASANAGVTLTLDGNYQWFDSKWAYTNPPTSKIDDHAGYGAMLGYRFDSGFGLDLDWQHTDSQRVIIPGNAKIHDTINDLVSLNGYYAFNRYGVFQPYLLLGGGQSDMREKTTGLSSIDTVGNAGIGAFIALSDNVAIRGEVREVHNFDHSFNDGLALLGITFNTGNSRPQAAPAPEPAPVVAPPPPPAPVDSDGDGVPDDKDKCPNTPAGVQVDANGCPLDSDNDGVPDYKDKCPNTPAGVQVDTNGCPLDSDNDGVPDYLDKCPNTPAGAKVDENGCPIVVKEAITREVKILFDTNKWEIKPEYKSEVEEVAKLAQQYPTSFIEIQGFTDNTGGKKHNKELSQHRANSVRDMLVHDFAVDPNRVTAVGYGASNFVADNKSAEGKAKNRRVIAVLSGTRHTIEMGAPIRERKTPLKRHHHHKAAAATTAAPAAPAAPAAQ